MALINSRTSSDLDESVESGMEGEIREFVRCDVASQRPHLEDHSEIIASNIGALLQRVAGTSVQGIDILIIELQTLRVRLNAEADRLQREIIEYAKLSQASMQSTKIIAESISSWKELPNARIARD